MGVKQFTEVDAGNYQCLYFEGARFTAENHRMPLFSEMIPIPTDSEAIGVKPEDAVYVQADINEEALVDIGMLSSEIICNVSTVIERNTPRAQVEFYPFRLNPASGKIEKLVQCRLTVQYLKSNESTTAKRLSTTSSVLATGSWIKMGLKNTGIYKLTYTDLVNMGLNPVH